MARKRTHWRKDPEILARLPEVERMHLAGMSNRAIAAKIGVDEGTIRSDLKRIVELWTERVQDTSEARRARRLAELEDLRTRAISAAEWDEACEKAVLFGVNVPDLGAVQRDDKGSVQFRGNKAAALNVARQAIMDAAKLEGLVVDKKTLTDDEGKMLDLASILAEAKEIVGGSGGASPADPQPVA